MNSKFFRKALLFDKNSHESVTCRLCRHMCHILPDKIGLCGVRINNNGELYTMVFGRLAACGADPIEKKPLFNFLPGTTSLSIATVGCNFRCSFCQNYSLSDVPKSGEAELTGSWVSPETIVSKALECGAESISYTYSEPTIFFEYAYETAKLAHEKGLLNVFVSNGYMTREAIDMISPYLDAINVDLKTFNPKNYEKICGAKLDGVLDTIKYIKRKKIWMEITTLVVTDMNDTEKELEDIACFIASVGKEIPWHISRFHPVFKMRDRPPTMPEKLFMAAKLGKEAGLRYVFTGNIYNPTGENTICPHCNKCIIERNAFSVSNILLDEGNCLFCGKAIDGIWGNFKKG